MAQVRRPPRYRSPPPRQIPSLPNPIRVQLPTRNRIRAIPSNDPNHPGQSLLTLTPSTNQLSNTNLVEESIILPPLNTDVEVLLGKKHLPVYAQFPFDMSILPQPMEINIEDNVHKLRLRLIDSELHHQRRSTDEYIKRTHRIGIDSDLPNSMEIERELEMRRMQGSINQRRRSNQPMMTSSYSHDPRLHLQPVDEESVYISSNMDDLIDSMARRHLAHRRFDTAVDQQRQSNGFHGSPLEPLKTGRTTFRNDDSFYTNRSSRINSNGFNQRLRSRIDYYNRIQPDLDHTVHDDSIRRNSYKKLPPISPGHDSNRLNHLKDPSTSTFYDNQTDRSEHVLDLSDDIYHSTRTRQQSISKDSMNNRKNSDNGEFDVVKPTERLFSGYDEFFTESSNEPRKKSKVHRRNAFRKIAIGILFITTLKHRSTQTSSKRERKSPSAAIHKIRLQEIIVALHRVYLEPDGPIFNALIHAISSPISLENALDRSAENYVQAIQMIGNALKNIVARTVEFMPKDGVLGTAKTSALSVLLQNGNPFPENYFWQCERQLLEFNDLKVINITKQRAILLFIGIFIFRALVTTLLIKPVKYRLILGQLKSNQSASLKVLASVILYIGRRVVGTKSQMLAFPHEWQLSLYTDADLQNIIEHSEMKSIIDTCEQSLHRWCEEYIRRIDESSGKEQRK